jgi:predicted DCC family thiol-disulfide oxidoreductase YuxK
MIPIDMARDGTSEWSVLYDADCGFCRWALARVLALDRDYRLRPVALGTPAADALLAEIRVEQRAASWHLVAPDGQRWSAGAAAPPLLRLLPAGSGPAWALAAAPAVTDRGYRWVAEHRSLLSRAVPARAKDRATEQINQRR